VLAQALSLAQLDTTLARTFFEHSPPHTAVAAVVAAVCTVAVVAACTAAERTLVCNLVAGST
jgi:hypothetical protein